MNVVQSRQVSTRMPDVPYSRIEKHGCRLEDVEVPLVAQDGSQLSHRVKVVNGQSDIAHVLNQAIDTTYEDEEHATR